MPFPITPQAVGVRQAQAQILRYDYTFCWPSEIIENGLTRQSCPNQEPAPALHEDSPLLGLVGQEMSGDVG